MFVYWLPLICWSLKLKRLKGFCLLMLPLICWWPLDEVLYGMDRYVWTLACCIWQKDISTCSLSVAWPDGYWLDRLHVGVW